MKFGQFLKLEYILESKELFTKDQLNKMSIEYSKIGNINPNTALYNRFVKSLEKLSKEQLEQLRDAKIKWVSLLANSILSYKKGN